MSERLWKPDIALQFAGTEHVQSPPAPDPIAEGAKTQSAVNTSILPGWCNTFVPRPQFLDKTPTTDDLYGPDPYNVNFCFPYLPQALNIDKIAIVPFIPRLHAEKLFMRIRQRPADLQYMKIPTPRTLEDLLAWIELTYRRKSSNMAFSVLCADSIGRWEVGGVVSLVDCNPDLMTAEIAMGLFYHESRGISRAKTILSLLLRYCLNTPTENIPGLGLRKVGLTAHSKNHLAQAIPLALGFRVESMLRWNRMALEGKVGNGRALRQGDPLSYPGIDDYYLVMCWDDWEMDGRRSAMATLGKREAKL